MCRTLPLFMKEIFFLRTNYIENHAGCSAKRVIPLKKKEKKEAESMFFFRYKI